MSVSYPNQYRNYFLFDIKERISLGQIEASLKSPNSVAEVLEDLYTLNLMLDEGNKDVAKLYPVLSQYNDSKSPNSQTFLAGI